jgi:hypothetical protein
MMLIGDFHYYIALFLFGEVKPHFAILFTEKFFEPASTINLHRILSC